MAQTNYRRTLVGQQSGVQVNMPVDRVERLLADEGDQSFAVVGRFQRGRIDKPFRVSVSKINRYLGTARSMRASAANETFVQIYEAFQYGAAAAVVSRVSSSSAVNKWIVVKHGASGNIIVQEEMPQSSDTNWIAAFKVADCINEGIHFTVSKEDTEDELRIVIREREKDSRGTDVDTGEVLYDFTGSTDPDAKDDMGVGYYLADVAAKYYGDWLTVLVNSAAAKVLTNDAFDKKAVSAVVQPYVDGAEPDTTNYQKAAKALGQTPIPFKYILSESSNTSLVSALLDVGQKWNRIMFQEVSGSLTPEAAINWKNTFQYDAQGGMYCMWIWSPIKRDDPTGAGGNMLFGTVGQKVGLACKRNAIVNGFGLPALNQPIAGKDFMLSGTNFEQSYLPDDVELATLAKAHINPVQYVTYHDGSGYVWDDSLSGAKKNGISRLENAAEVSVWTQDQFGKYARSLVQKPMTKAIQLMTRFAEDTLQSMEASEWLVSSSALGGRAYTFSVAPNERDPETTMDVVLNLAIDGVVRRINISQNMYSRS